jgi:hypothetical protein
MLCIYLLVAAKSFVVLGSIQLSGGCQILAGTRMQPEKQLVTIGVVYV